MERHANKTRQLILANNIGKYNCAVCTCSQLTMEKWDYNYIMVHISHFRKSNYFSVCIFLKMKGQCCSPWQTFSIWQHFRYWIAYCCAIEHKELGMKYQPESSKWYLPKSVWWFDLLCEIYSGTCNFLILPWPVIVLIADIMFNATQA